MSGSDPQIQQAPASTSNNTTTSTSAPWNEQQPYLLAGFQKAAANASSPQPYYPNQTYANPSPETNLAYQSLANQAQNNLQNGGTPLVQQSAQTLSNNMTGNVSDLANNAKAAGIGNFDPTLGGILSDSNMGDYNKSLQDAAQIGVNRTLPMITSQFTNSGRSGSGLERTAIAQTAADAATNAQAGLLQNKLGLQAGAYGQSQSVLPDYLKTAQQVQDKAAMYAPVASAQAQQTPIDQLLSVGQFQQGNAQNAINEDINRYNYAQNLPQDQLQQYLSAINGNYGNSTSQTGAAPYYPIPGSPGSAQTIMGNVLGGGLLANSLFSSAGQNNGLSNIFSSVFG